MVKLILKQILKKITQRFNVSGMFYSADWTAASCSANDVVLTDSLTLPAGKYVLTVSYPNLSTSEYSTAIWINGARAGRYIRQLTTNSTSIVMNLSTTASVQLRSSQSTACTFSYLTRGGLLALRIA